LIPKNIVTASQNIVSILSNIVEAMKNIVLEPKITVAMPDASVRTSKKMTVAPPTKQCTKIQNPVSKAGSSQHGLRVGTFDLSDNEYYYVIIH
jgi:hypothetical protein